MIDPRFYRLLGPLSAAQLAGAGAAIRGDGGRLVSAAGPIHAAGPDDMSFHEGRQGPPVTRAGLVFAHPRHAEVLAAGGAVVAESQEPRAAFARALRLLVEERDFDPGEAALISSLARLEEGVRVSPGAVIGPGAEIGAGSVIGPGAIVGVGVAIGRRCRVGPGAVVTFALLGDDVTVHANAVIGASGFGVAVSSSGPVDVPHLGRVILQDGVTIGAATTVDRGQFSDTVVAEGAKIDNLCQIAHNVTVGRGAVIAAFGGISGSSTIGDGAMLGGRVGVADHRSIGTRAMLAAGSAVMHDVPAGETWAGYPAKPIRRWLREIAWLGKAIGSNDGGRD